jgi:hypothetical protein
MGHLRDLDRMSAGGDAYERFRRHLVGSLEGLLLERREEMEHPRPELAVRLGLSAVMGVIEAGLVRPDASGELEGGGVVTREELVDECTDLLLSYLTGGTTGRGTEPVEFFDVWG